MPYPAKNIVFTVCEHPVRANWCILVANKGNWQQLKFRHNDYNEMLTVSDSNRGKDTDDYTLIMPACIDSQLRKGVFECDHNAHYHEILRDMQALGYTFDGFLESYVKANRQAIFEGLEGVKIPPKQGKTIWEHLLGDT